MTRLTTMVAVSGLVLGVSAPALWAADAPSSATSPSAVSAQPSTTPAPQTTAQATQATVKPQQTVRRIYRPDDHVANKLNSDVLARINAVNAANYGSSR